MAKRCLTLLILYFVTLLLIPTLVLAGGGNYSSVNFSSGDVVAGRSKEVVIKVYDWNTSPDQAKAKDETNAPLMVGEEFKFVAHGDLPGSECRTTQAKSDGAGQIKALCSASTTGRFVFHVEPLTRLDAGNSAEFVLYFSEATPTTTPQPGASGDPKAPFVSTAAGPCGSGVETLSYPYPSQCGSGTHQVGYLKCNNGFAVKFFRPQCVAQVDKSWDDLMYGVCNHAACTVAQVRSITTPNAQMVVLKKESPTSAPKATPVTNAATISPTNVPVASNSKPEAYFLVTENEASDKGSHDVKVYLTGTLDRDKLYQVYFFPLGSFSNSRNSTKALQNIKVLSDNDNPWATLDAKFKLDLVKQQPIATLQQPPQLFNTTNKNEFANFIKANNIKLTATDQKLTDLWLSNDQEQMLALVVDKNSLPNSGSVPAWLPPLEITYDQASILEMYYPFAWQQEHADPGLNIKFTFVFLTQDPYLAKNIRFPWDQRGYEIQPASVQLRAGEYIKAKYLSVLSINILPLDTPLLTIARLYADEGRSLLESQTLTGDPTPLEPDTAPKKEQGETVVTEFRKIQFQELVIFGVILLLIVAAVVMWRRRRFHTTWFK